MIEPAVSSSSTGFLPYQTGRVDDGPVDDRPRNQSQQRDDHQRDALSETFVPLFDTPVVHQHIADSPGTAQRVDHAGEHREEQIRPVAVAGARTGSDLVEDRRKRLRIRQIQLLFRKKDSTGVEIKEMASDMVWLVQWQTTAVPELFVVQDRLASRVTGGEESCLRRLVADRRIFDTRTIAIDVAISCQIYSENR